MAVLIGSARIDENGRTKNGRAGDQKGREVSTQRWYLHPKGWVMLRAKERDAREKIALCMERACANKCIGYDQMQRTSLYKACTDMGTFDAGHIDIPCETDCSALVRVCCAYAGIAAKNFTTATEVSALLATGAFRLLEDGAFTGTQRLLLRGDILVTRTKGHTAVALSNGRGLRMGDRGRDVLYMQKALLSLGYSLGICGADGIFGRKTRSAVGRFCKDRGLTAGSEFAAEMEEMLYA